MKYITITASSYDEAVSRARSEYGENVRIHSRRDYSIGGGLFSKKKNRCELTVYVLENQDGHNSDAPVNDEQSLKEFEKEAQTPDPSSLSLQERLDTEIHRSRQSRLDLREAEKILDLNSVSNPLREEILSSLSGNMELGSEIASIIVDRVDIAHAELSMPSHILVLMGATGSGKTTTGAKIASVYQSAGKKVAIIALDSYRVGAFAQVRGLSDALNLSYELITVEDELVKALERFSYFDLVIVDTMGLSPKDKELNLRLQAMLSMINRSASCFAFVASASTKEEDLEAQAERYRIFNPDVMIATKLDETESIGSMISFSYRQRLPLLFLTTGQAVPEDIEKASTTTILGHFKGLGLDMNRSGFQV